MTKIDVFSGFLGAGKTTLIKKLIKEAYSGEKLVLIENEFGEIGVDGGFMKEAGIQINELNSGCICCSLVGDFAKALRRVKEEYNPDRILIEPSGVGKLSDVVKAVERASLDDCVINSLTTVVDANKCKIYMKNFGEFFNDQIENAACIVFSHADVAPVEKIEKAVELVKGHNPNATIVSSDWNSLTGEQILSAMEHSSTLADELAKLTHQLEEEHEHCHHDHDGEEHEHCHHDHDDEEHEHCHHDHDGEEHEHCHHDHDDEEHEHCHHDHDEEHEHCHHDHDDEEHEHCHHDHDDEEHEHCHHDHDGEEHEHCCHDHDHEGHEHHHHHHHADEVFTSWGVETAKRFSEKLLKLSLASLVDSTRFGMVLRAKGIVEGQNGEWLHFDYVPGEINVRVGGAETIGRLCVIGSKLDEEELKELFGV
ncbi:MAG: GTP-binding protein [Candidatus Coproplasma sp.]